MSRTTRYTAGETTRSTKHAYDPACSCSRCEQQEQAILRQQERQPHQAQPLRLSIGGQVQTLHMRGSW